MPIDNQDAQGRRQRKKRCALCWLCVPREFSVVFCRLSVFSGVDAVLFVVNLAEITKLNLMIAAFAELLNGKIFSTAPVSLVLHNQDTFQAAVAQNPAALCSAFPDFTDRSVFRCS